MAKADDLFIKMCQDVLAENNLNECRAVWKDSGEQSKTVSKFCVVNRYNLKEEFPILTLRPIALKKAIDEVLWIYQKKSNNVHDLNSHVWDDWADINGSIGMAYGYQVKSKLRRVMTDLPNEKQTLENGTTTGIMTNEFVDQTDYVLHELKYNPYSRRIIINLFDVGEVDMMGLEPCAFMVNFKVTDNKETGKHVLNAILYQRSQDILAANGWNVAQYAILVHMFAQVTDMEVGEFVHVIADAHIYDRHIDTVKELMQRKPYPAPKLWINPDVKDFYDFTVDDFKLIDYQHGEPVKGIDVAV